MAMTEWLGDAVRSHKHGRARVSPHMTAPAKHVWIALLVVYVVWGSTYFGIKVAVETIPPLLAVHLGFFAPDDPRALRHVDAVRSSLSVDGGLLRRYTVQDDFGHMEAAFTVCTFWLVEALALIGRTDEARALFDRLLSLDNGLGLYSEDILPDTLEQSGNFPQTYSHVGLINAAFRLARRWD